MPNMRRWLVCNLGIDGMYELRCRHVLSFGRKRMHKLQRWGLLRKQWLSKLHGMSERHVFYNHRWSRLLELQQLRCGHIPVKLRRFHVLFLSNRLILVHYASTFPRKLHKLCAWYFLADRGAVMFELCCRHVHGNIRGERMFVMCGWKILVYYRRDQHLELRNLSRGLLCYCWCERLHDLFPGLLPNKC